MNESDKTMWNQWPRLFLAVACVALSLGFRGEAQEIFTLKGRLIAEGRIFGVARYDFDKDGRPDIVVSDYLNPARVLLNDAGLEFKKVAPLTSTAETAKTGHGVALADFNGDGRLDLFLVYNEYPSRILLGDGKGGFADTGRTIGAPGLFGTSAAVADIDQDGDSDAFVTYYQERARLYLNDGTGALAVSDQIFFNGVAVTDLDGDGQVRPPLVFEYAWPSSKSNPAMKKWVHTSFWSYV